jgi:hypothetical protein
MPLDVLAMSFHYNDTTNVWLAEISFSLQGASLNVVVGIRATRLDFLFNSSSKILVVDQGTDTVRLSRSMCQDPSEAGSGASSRLGLVLGLAIGLISLVALAAIVVYKRLYRQPSVDLTPLLDQVSSDDNPIPQYTQ